MSDIPKITEKAIRDRVDARSFGRGKDYFQAGAIFDAKRQGRTLKARCEGTQAASYRVRVAFDAAGKVAEAECSCPVGDGGFCKHVVALLLTWRAKPKEFAEVEGLEASLDRRSKAELIALVKQMLRREPDLDVLLEAPLPGGGKRRTPVGPETYGRQAAAAFRGYDPGDYGGGSGVAQELKAILETGNDFLAQDDPSSASAVFEGVAGAVFDNYESVDDEGGDLHSVVSGCVTGLGKCLAALKGEPARRESMLKALVRSYDFVEDYGGDSEEEVPALIARHADPEERRTVVGWLRDKLADRGKGEFSSYRRQTYAEFLIELEGDRLDDEDFLRVCRDSGLTADLVDRLLERGRVGEAVEELGRADVHEILRLADIFVGHRQGATAERVVRERSAEARGHDTQALEWLKRRASARRDRAAVRELAEAIFRKSPSFERYKELRQLARKSGDWEALKPQSLEILEKTRHDDLIRVYLDEGELDRAIAAVEAESRPRPARGYAYPSLSVSAMGLEVARAAESDRPRAALTIYRKYAEALIDARGRDNYKEACRHLKTIKALFATLREPGEWAAYLDGLRERHRILRAFQQELAAAKL